MLAKDCHLFEHMIAAAFIMQVFTNTASEYGFDADAIWLAIR